MFLERSFTRWRLILTQQPRSSTTGLHRNDECPAPNRLPRYPAEQGFSDLRMKLMVRMGQSELAAEAEQCRLQALSYLGTREASFLLRVAREFDDLARVASEGRQLSDSSEQPTRVHPAR